MRKSLIETGERNRKAAEKFEKDMLVRVENSKAKYKQQKELCAELEYRVIEDEKHYERKLNASYNDKEVHDLQRTVLEMEQEAEALDEQNAQMEAELERY